MAEKLRLGVLISGGGTNLQAIIDACRQPDFPARVVVVGSNNRAAHGLARARAADISTFAVSHRGTKNREEHEAEILRRLEPHGIELLVLAGYMRVVTPLLIDRFHNRKLGLPGVVNIHPADTRAYQGAHGYEFAMGMLPDHPRRLNETRITVHFVDAGVDTGPIIMQAPVPVRPDDTLDRLRQRGLAVEHRIYPEAIRLYAQGRLRLEGSRVIIKEQEA